MLHVLVGDEAWMEDDIRWAARSHAQHVIAWLADHATLDFLLALHLDFGRLVHNIRLLNGHVWIEIDFG